MRALTQPCDIGAISPKGNSENFGVFVRCPKLESAQVLLKAVQELCDTLKAKVTEDAAGLHFEIKDDGSAEYQKAAQLTREANE